jgi:hypothetical protein
MKLTASFAGSLQADMQAELPTSVVGQWDIRLARVLPAETPRGLPVSDRKDAHARLPLPAQTLSASVESARPTLLPAPTSNP